MRRLLKVVTAGALTLAATVVAGPALPAHADTQICSQYGTTRIQGGKYVVQNNVWGDSTTQCINVTNSGFRITSAVHNVPQTGAPAAYPSVYVGCYFNTCSDGSALPLQASNSR